MKAFLSLLFLNLRRFIFTAFANVYRNIYILFSVVLVVSFLILLLNTFFVFQRISTISVDKINEKIDMVVNLKKGADEEKAEDLKTKLEKLDGVKSVIFFSKEDEFREFKTNHPEDAEIFEDKMFKDIENPFSGRLQIITNSPKFHPKIFSFLKKNKFEEIIDTDEIKKEVYFFVLLRKKDMNENIKKKILSSSKIFDVNEITSSDEVQNVLKEIFGNKEEFDFFIEKNNIENNVVILSVKTEYPEFSQDAKNFLKNTFDKKILLIKKKKTRDTEAKSILEETSQWIISFSDKLMNVQIFVFMIILFSVFTIFISIIHSSVRSRKNEIYIMKLVGAKYIYIRMPFLIEGIIYGMLSSILGIVLFLLLFSFFDFESISNVLFISNLDIKNSMISYRDIIFEIVIFSLFGFLSAIISTIIFIDFDDEKRS